MKLAVQARASVETHVYQENKGREEIKEKGGGGDDDAGRTLEIEEDFNNS